MQALMFAYKKMVQHASQWMEFFHIHNSFLGHERDKGGFPQGNLTQNFEVSQVLLLCSMRSSCKFQCLPPSSCSVVFWQVPIWSFLGRLCNQASPNSIIWITTAWPRHILYKLQGINWSSFGLQHQPKLTPISVSVGFERENVCYVNRGLSILCLISRSLYGREGFWFRSRSLWHLQGAAGYLL